MQSTCLQFYAKINPSKEEPDIERTIKEELAATNAKDRAKLFQIFRKIGVKLHHMFYELTDSDGTLGNLL